MWLASTPWGVQQCVWEVVPLAALEAMGGEAHARAEGQCSGPPVAVVGVAGHAGLLHGMWAHLRAFANLGHARGGTRSTQPTPGFGWWTAAFSAPGRRLLRLTDARADTAQEPVHVLCLPCLVCLPGLEGCFCVGGRLWDKWGLCSWEALGFSMEEVRKQHPGGRYWLTPPYSCLVSGSSWAGGWWGTTKGGLLVLCGCVLARSYVGVGPGCGREN